MAALFPDTDTVLRFVVAVSAAITIGAMVAVVARYYRTYKMRPRDGTRLLPWHIAAVSAGTGGYVVVAASAVITSPSLSWRSWAYLASSVLILASMVLIGQHVGRGKGGDEQ